MAITLPYPNLTFVPLDVLTADQLNNMNANTKALANAFPLTAANIGNGAITNAKLADSSVDGTKLDWLNTFQFNDNKVSSPITMVDTDWTTPMSLSVAGMPVGAKFIVGVTLAFGGGSNNIGMSVRIQHGSNYSMEVTQTTAWAKSVSLQYSFTKQTNASTVVIQAKKDNTETATISGGYAYVMRVAS